MDIQYATIVSSYWITGSRNCLYRASFQKRSTTISGFIQRSHGRYNLKKSVGSAGVKLMSLDCVGAIKEEGIETGISIRSKV